MISAGKITAILCMLVAGTGIGTGHAADTVKAGRIAGRQNETATQAKDTDKLFVEILESLPDEARAMVDSAGARSQEKKTENATNSTAVVKIAAGLPDAGSESALQNRRQRLDQLPDKLRLQVEKAISDIDKRQAEKAVEFKEINRKRATDE